MEERRDKYQDSLLLIETQIEEFNEEAAVEELARHEQTEKELEEELKSQEKISQDLDLDLVTLKEQEKKLIDQEEEYWKL